MYFHCVFFHTILTVAWNTWRGNFTIIPEWYSISLVVFIIWTSLVCFEHPRPIVLNVTIQQSYPY